MGIDHLRAKAAPREARVRILMNAALEDEHAALEDQLRSQPDTLARGENAKALAAQLVALEERMTAEEDELLFRSVGTSAWLQLMAEHPPTEADKGLDHNPRTFQPAAVAASCVDPEMSVEDAVWLMDTLPPAQWWQVWDVVLEVNRGASQRPKSLLASALLRSNGTSPTTSGPEGSLGASS